MQPLTNSLACARYSLSLTEKPRCNARVPLALLAVGIYLLGAVTGGGLQALLRQSIEGAKWRAAGTP
jgi:hypothetical protein